MSWTYELRYVRCGKHGCRCESGPQHGPYWYGYEHRGGRVYTKYFGKRPKSTFTFAKDGPDAPPERFTFRGRMDFRTALRIFAFDKKPNGATLVARYRALAFEYHPDRGGDTAIMAAINAAYGYLRA